MPLFLKKCTVSILWLLALVLGSCGTDPGSTASIGGSGITQFTYETGEVHAVVNVEGTNITVAAILFDVNPETAQVEQAASLAPGVTVEFDNELDFNAELTNQSLQSLNCSSNPTLVAVQTYSLFAIYQYVYPDDCTPTSSDTVSAQAAVVVMQEGSPNKVIVSTPTIWEQEAYLKAPNAQAADSFGFSIAISGDTVVVGANAEDSNQTTITNGPTASSDNSAPAAGAVYVFKRTGSTWVQEAYLKAPNADINDQFGTSVSISSDTIVVGAVNEESNQTTITNGTTASSDNSANDAGAAYVFRRTGTSWAQEAYLKAPNAEAGDYFGLSVAVSSDTIVVGAYQESSNQTTITNGTSASGDNSAPDAGAAYVFRRTGTTWAQEAYLKAPNAEGGDNFGSYVAVDSDTIAVAAVVEDSGQTTITNGPTASSDNSASGAGAVYVFKRNGTDWAQEAYIKAAEVDASDDYGYEVGLSSNTLVVGAIGEASNQTTITNGTTASNDDSLSFTGAAYIYKRTGVTWAQEAFIKPPNPDASDYFGWAVAISGDRVVVGAPQEDSNQTTITNGTTASSNNSASNSGAAYVFKRTVDTWAQEAYLKAPNADVNDTFGTSVGISSSTVVVGARGESSNQTTITNGNTASSNNSAGFAGAAYVFRR